MRVFAVLEGESEEIAFYVVDEEVFSKLPAAVFGDEEASEVLEEVVKRGRRPFSVKPDYTLR